MTFTTLVEAFRHQVTDRPGAVALVAESIDRPRSISWRQLGKAVTRVASALAKRLDSESVPRRIGYASDNGPGDILIALASMTIGAIEVPIDHRLGGQQIANRWDRVGGLWLDRDFCQRLVADAMVGSSKGSGDTGFSTPRVEIDAPSLILWTSGTTGAPQGVMLSQGNLAGNAAAKLAAVPQTGDDVRLCVLPLSHAYARTCDFGTWLLSGCTLVPTLGYSGLLRMAPVVTPTLINSVPRLAYRLLDKPQGVPGLDRLRLLGCGGAAISGSAFVRWKDRGVTVIQGYGLTEASPVICSATPDDASPGQVGRLVDGWQAEIRDGQLFVRGPHTMLGYWNNAQATSRKIDPQGWLATGDLVERDGPGGRFRILGRADEVIVLDSAKKIFPSSIEREVERISGVRHALLVYRDSLQLWFDADEASQPRLEHAIGELVRELPECQSCSVHRFKTPLTQAAGELTAKGTVRRARILETRFR